MKTTDNTKSREQVLLDGIAELAWFLHPEDEPYRKEYGAHRGFDPDEPSLYEWDSDTPVCVSELVDRIRRDARAARPDQASDCYVTFFRSPQASEELEADNDVTIKLGPFTGLQTTYTELRDLANGESIASWDGEWWTLEDSCLPISDFTIVFDRSTTED